MGKPRFGVRILDDEALFNEYYIDNGPGYSTNNIYNRMESEGTINPSTGKPPTKSAIWQAIARHAARHYDEAKVKNVIMRKWLDNGVVATDEDYYAYISRSARTAFSTDQYRNWVKKQPDKIPDYSGG